MKRSTLLLLLFGIPALVAGLAVVTAMPVSEVNSSGPAEVQDEPGHGLAEDQPEWELMLEGVHGAVAVCPHNSEVIYVAVRGTTSDYNGGMLKSTDGGQSWEHYSEGWALGRPLDILIHPDDPEVVMVSGTGTSVVKSSDGGRTWKYAGYGVRGSSHGSDGYELAYHRRDSLYYLANDARWVGGIYHSEDGVNWEITYDYAVRSLLLDEAVQTIYAGGAGLAYVLRSMDDGKTWDSKHDGMEKSARQLVRVPGSRTVYAGTHRGVYKTYDRAENWISVNDTLTEQLNFRGGLAISERDTSTVFAGGSGSSLRGVTGGVFVSRDSGVSWQRYNAGMPENVDLRVHDLFLDDSSHTLYAAIGYVEYVDDTPNSVYEVYRLNDAVDAAPGNGPPENLPESVQLDANYPNPFNPVTTIEYALPVETEVTLQIYDVAGRAVETLVDELQAPGRHQISWDAGGLPSGVYIYRLRAGETVRSRKMMFIK